MKQTWSQSATLYLGALALGCWIVMFMAGHDVWHDSGRPDLHLMGATNFDLRAFAGAFYLLFVVLVAHLLLGVAGLVRGRRGVLPGR